jgi:hypothetical protein
LIKKSIELSILCNSQISLVIFGSDNTLYEYCSTDPRQVLQRYCQVAHLPHDRLTNEDYDSKKNKLKKKGFKKKKKMMKVITKQQIYKTFPLDKTLK